MTTTTKIEYLPIDQLNLDPTNPRLGRNVASPDLLQEKVIDAMQDWTLDELAVSFLESGFWPQEALIVVKEKLYGQEQYVVVEGNRRLAALKLLQKAIGGDIKSKKWAEIIDGKKLPAGFFENIPYILVGDRKTVSAYLGFRHVTGIKEWNPAEKAQYISKLIDENHFTYDEVRRKIGSKTPTVRQNYIAYKLLRQMEQQEGIAIEKVEEKFSVLYLSLRTHGAKQYLHIDIEATPDKAATPVPKEHTDNLVKFALWLFGDEKRPPLFTDSRYVDQFGKILESEEAVEYLERTDDPRWEVAYRKAGVGEQELIDFVEGASDNIQQALSEVHLFKKSEKVRKAIGRLGKDSAALLAYFPDIRNDILKEMQEDAGST
jgi:ParB-like chromosome segregation protein Spo0J